MTNIAQSCTTFRTAIDLAFAPRPLPDSFPGQNWDIDRAYLQNTLHLARLRVFPDVTSPCGLGAAVVLRRYLPKPNDRGYSRKLWEPALITLPHDISGPEIMSALSEPMPPTEPQEERLALDLTQTLAQLYWHTLPEVSDPWDSLQCTHGTRLPSDKNPKLRFAFNDPNSLCAYWRIHNGALPWHRAFTRWGLTVP